MSKNQSLGVYIIVGIIALLLAVVAFAGPSTTSSEISYSQFMDKVSSGEIESVLISKNSLAAIPKSKEGAQTKPVKTPNADIVGLSNVNQPATFQYKVQIPENDPNLLALLEKNNVEINVKKPQEGSILGTIGSLLVPIFFIGLIILLLRGIQQGGSAAMNFGKSRAKLMQENKVQITFADVQGMDEEKQDLEEIVDFLKNG